jgi:poly(A) polymerase
MPRMQTSAMSVSCLLRISSLERNTTAAMAYARKHATEVIRTLRERGHQAYLCGGCVRDLLLGRTPSDYDVATDATPQQVMAIFPRTFAVGAQFGVVLVPFFAAGDDSVLAPTGEGARLGPNGLATLSGDNGEPRGKGNVIEVATFRADVGYSDGRHPDEVRFSSDPREDVRRRDFTINGLLLDPVTNEVLDFVGGREDLKAGVIRTIGDAAQRFAEDKLRLLRAVRFAARFEYEIEASLFGAIQQLATQIKQVSRERVRDELTKMLTEGRARRAFQLLDDSGLLQEVLPEISAMKGVEQPPQFHPEGDVFVHTLLLLEKLQAGCSKTLAWGALLHDVGKPPTFRVAPDRIRFDGHVEVGVKMASEICRRLRFSSEETEQILALVDNHMRFADVQRMRESTLKRFLRLPGFDEHLELHRMDCLSSNGQLASYEFALQQARALPPEAIRPAPLITGADLIEAGYEPGPRFKQILAAVEDAQLEGRIASRAEALEFVQQEFSIGN